MIGWNQSLSFLQYGPKLKEMRKILRNSIGTKESLRKEGLVDNIEESGRKFVEQLLDWSIHGGGKGAGGDVGSIIRK